LRGEIAEEAADAGLALLLQIEIAITPVQTLVAQAFAIAGRFERTVYDATYLALALEEDAILVTSDKRSCNALRGTALKAHIRWIGDVASA
jgi:predicted nucleic acid-binding protein